MHAMKVLSEHHIRRHLQGVRDVVKSNQRFVTISTKMMKIWLFPYQKCSLEVLVELQLFTDVY